MSEIILVRHAQSLNNALGEEGRVPDPSLTELGFLQAKRLKEQLAVLAADQFYVSAFRRALETAAPFANDHQARFQIWRDIHEVGGCYSGRVGEEKLAQPGMTPQCIGREFQWATPESQWTDGGWNQMDRHESVEDALPRVDRVAETFRREFSNLQKRIVLVTHGEFISLLLGRLIGHGTPFFVRPRSIYNTAITKLNMTDKGCELVEFNRVCHLSGSELTS